MKELVTVALASWTQQQILAQLDSGSHWSGSTITYAFPTSSSGLYGSQELAGFQGSEFRPAGRRHTCAADLG
jgi:hypothetical protein